MMMKRQGVVLLALLPFAFCRLGYDLRPTQTNYATDQFDFEWGWTPVPTAIPHVFGEVNRRQALPPNSTCGFISGLSTSTLTCNNGLDCGFQSSYDAVGCCTGYYLSGSEYTLDGCTFFTTCYDSTAVAVSCDSACQANTHNLQCTYTAAPYCMTWSFTDIGYTNLGCYEFSGLTEDVALTYNAPSTTTTSSSSGGTIIVTSGSTTISQTTSSSSASSSTLTTTTPSSTTSIPPPVIFTTSATLSTPGTSSTASSPVPSSLSLSPSSVSGMSTSSSTVVSIISANSASMFSDTVSTAPASTTSFSSISSSSATDSAGGAGAVTANTASTGSTATGTGTATDTTIAAGASGSGSSSAQSSSGSSSDTGAIVGGAVGGAAGLAIIAGLIWFFVRRKKRNGTDPPASEVSHHASMPYPYSPVSPNTQGPSHYGSPEQVHEFPAAPAAGAYNHPMDHPQSTYQPGRGYGNAHEISSEGTGSSQPLHPGYSNAPEVVPQGGYRGLDPTGGYTQPGASYGADPGFYGRPYSEMP